MLRAPDWLGDKAKRKWQQLRKLLPTITERDGDALALLCDSWERFHDTAEIIKRDGYVLVCQNSRTFINPAVNAHNESWKQIVKLSGAFGLTPEMGGSVGAVASSPIQRLIEER